MSRVHWAALAVWAGVGGRAITHLLERFGSLEAALAAPHEALLRVPHIGPQTAQAIARLDLAAVEAELARFAREGIQTHTWQDATYPANLLRAPDAPPVLFSRGALAPEDARAAAIVGARAPGPRSTDLAQRIARELARRGWTVVSGLALGIDAAAHQGALEADGRTLAVLGSGVGVVYPRRHAALAAEVERQGALLSEQHPQAAVSRQSLVARNRITSGLSRAVIVVQSSADSGSASTARRAVAQGRAVFAVVEGETQDALPVEEAIPLPPEGIDWDALSEQLAQAAIQPPRQPAAQPRLF